MGINDAYMMIDGTPPTIDFASGAVASNPFGSVSQTRTTRIRDVIDTARTRHWALAETSLPDGAALMNLRVRERELLAKYANEIEGLVGTTIQYNVTKQALSGSLFQMTGDVPTIVAPGQDGWPIQIGADGVPFVDTTGPMLAGDPFGQRGGLQGFPLPRTMVRLIGARVILENGQIQRFNIVSESERLAALDGRDPAAFVSNNRFVPMFNTPALNSTQNNTFNYIWNAARWACVAAIQISYIEMSNPKTLDDFLALPDVLAGALIAYMAKMMGMQSERVSVQERRMLVDEEIRAVAEGAESADGLIGPAPNISVEYNG